MKRIALIAFIALCAAGSAVAVPLRSPLFHPRVAVPASSSFAVTHVVVIVQENRSFDNLFNGYPNANSVVVDPYTGTHLRRISMGGQQSNWDPNHAHLQNKTNKGGFVTECAAPVASTICAMTGFSTESVQGCSTGCPGSFAYIRPEETAPYFALAKQGELLDDLFQCNSGPSFPAHQCIIAGQDGGYLPGGGIDTSSPYAWSNNAHNPDCADTNSHGQAVLVTSPYPGIPFKIPFCSTYTTIFDEANAAGLTWRYYSHLSHGLWCGPCNVAQDAGSPNLIQPNYQFFTDLHNGELANITFIMPAGYWSDHPGLQKVSWAGTDWVGNLINQIERSPFASTTEVIVTWDDWGGWYDHVVPPIDQPNYYGFRVPGFILGPGVVPNQVDHTEHNQASFILGTIETLFGLPSLQQEDAQMAPFENFNFTAYPGAPKYRPVPTRSPPSWYKTFKDKGGSDRSETEPEGEVG